jgi:hypothetical protein
MVNANRPTGRSRHIDVQHFAIQEWWWHGDIKLAHIPGFTSLAGRSDQPLGCILHHRHVRRIMGHHGQYSALFELPFTKGCTISHRILGTREQSAVVLYLYAVACAPLRQCALSQNTATLWGCGKGVHIAIMLTLRLLAIVLSSLLNEL